MGSYLAVGERTGHRVVLKQFSFMGRLASNRTPTDIKGNNTAPDDLSLNCWGGLDRNIDNRLLIFRDTSALAPPRQSSLHTLNTFKSSKPGWWEVTGVHGEAGEG